MNAKNAMRNIRFFLPVPTIERIVNLWNILILVGSIILIIMMERPRKEKWIKGEYMRLLLPLTTRFELFDSSPLL